MLFRTIGAALGVLITSQSALAQGRIPTPPPPVKAKPASTDPLAAVIANSNGVAPAEAGNRAQALRDVQALIDQAVAYDSAAFAGVWVDEAPQFQVTIGFTGQEDRRAFLERVPPSLRRYVKVRSVSKSLTQNQADVDAILEAVKDSKIEFTVGFNPRTQQYEVNVADAGRVQAVRDLIPPNLRSIVKIERGATLKSFQTNVRTGDAVYGGWPMLDASGGGQCSFAFAGRDSYGRDGILSAAHCAQNPPYVSGADNAHYVQLPTWTERRYGDLYDFRHHAVVGMQTGYWVYFQNGQPVFQYPQYTNNVPGIYSDGYFTVFTTMKQSTSYNSYHYVGMPVCKSGFATHLTCGKVTNNWLSGTDDKGYTYRGFVQVSSSSQPVIAWGGDSGGAVFSYPDSGYNINAFGVLKGGNSATSGGPCTGSTCWYAYMPIDRVNDATPFNIYTTQGIMTP